MFILAAFARENQQIGHFAMFGLQRPNLINTFDGQITKLHVRWLEKRL